MRKFIASLCLSLCLFSFVARADDDDDAEDLRIKAIDAQHVVEMRHIVETTYLHSLPVGSGIDKNTKAYIDWKMAPYESLIRKEMPTKLRWKLLAGPSSTGKTEIDRIVESLAQKYGFEEPGRVKDQQGDREHTMNLGGLIEALERKKEELDQYANKKGYRAFKAQFVLTRGSIALDEATFSKPPAKDPIAEYRKHLRALQTKHARMDQRREALRALPVPTAPKEQDFGTDRKGYLKALKKYRKDLADYEIASARAPKPEEESYEEAVTELRKQLNKDLAEREITRNSMAEVWQAASGGWFKLSLEKEASQKAMTNITDAWNKLNDFVIAHKNEPLFRQLQVIQDQINDRQPDVDRNRDELVEIGRQKTTLQDKIAQFESIPSADVEEWLRGRNLFDQLSRVEAGKIPDFVDEMVAELRNKSVRRDQLGFDAGRGEDVSDLTKRFRQSVLETYAHQRTQLEDRDEALNRESTRLREEISTLKRQQREFAGVQTEGGLPNTSEAVLALIREYDELADKYYQEIRAAAHLLSARHAIIGEINKLNVQDLKSKYPAYYERLLHLNNHGEPVLNTVQAEEGVAAYLERLKQTPNIELKLLELIRMDPEGTRNLVKKAITDKGWLQKEVYLGNIDVQIKFNDLTMENNVNKRVEEIHNTKHREVTYDEFRQFYVDELKARHDWAREMLREYFPDIYESILHSSGGKGNPIATDRRFADGIFLLPKDANEMVTSVATTVEAQFEAWKRAMKMEHGLDVDAELFVHRNVPAVFIRDDQRAELGVGEAVVEVRYAMGKLLAKLTRDVLRKHAEKPDEPLHYKLVLADEADFGKLHDLTLRYTDPDFRGDEDKKNIPDEDKRHVIRETPPLGQRVARWSHSFNPAEKLKELGQVFEPVDHFPPPKPKVPEVATQAGTPGVPGTHDTVTGPPTVVGSHDAVNDGHQPTTGNASQPLKHLTEEEARARLSAEDPNLKQWQTALENAKEKRQSAQEKVRQLESEPHTTPAQLRDLEAAQGQLHVFQAEEAEAEAGVHAAEAHIGIEAARMVLGSMEPVLTQAQNTLEQMRAKRQAALGVVRELESHPRTTEAEKRALEQAEERLQGAEADVQRAEGDLRALQGAKQSAEARIQSATGEAAQADQTKTKKTQDKQQAQHDETIKQGLRQKAELAEKAEAERQHKEANKELSRFTLKLEEVLREHPTESKLKRYYDEIESQALKDKMLHVLFEKAAKREDRAKMTHVYQWLKFEHDAGKDIDDFLHKNFDEIRQNSTKNLAALFTNLVTEPEYRNELRTQVRPGFVGRITRKTCGWAFGKLYNWDVPPGSHVPDFMSSIFGGRR